MPYLMLMIVSGGMWFLRARVDCLQRNGRTSGSLCSQDIRSLFSRSIDMMAEFHRTGLLIRVLP